MSGYSIIKYPRTPHIEGSRLQPGDEDLCRIPFSDIAGKTVVVEEKCDGANTAVSFDTDGTLLLQSRGHYLTGEYREKHYNLFKQWASVHRDMLYALLGTRYILYGEWLHAKHAVFYNALPHYFVEFDMLDRQTGRFLDTPSRHRMLSGLPIVSAPVIRVGMFSSLDELTRLLGPSQYIRAGHREDLRRQCEAMGLDAGKIFAETDATGTMEGLYIKVETDGEVTRRMKYVRSTFLQNIVTSEAHWLERPLVQNLLKYPADRLFAPSLPEEDDHAQ